MNVLMGQYLRKMVQEELKNKNINEEILNNPRSKEIGDILISLVEKMGNISQEYIPLYESQMQARMKIILQSIDCLQVDNNGNAIISFEEFNNRYLKKEEQKNNGTITYEILAEGTMARTTESQQEGKTISIMDQFGIERGKKVQKDGKEIMITRLKECPHIVKVAKAGEEKYYDISQTENPEDIQIKGAEEVSQGQIKQLDEVSKIRMREKVDTHYKKGIKSMYGIEDSLGENIGRGE